MKDSKLGFTEVLAMAIGALIGGGIFAVLGVASSIAGQKVIYSYIISGLVALATGYSYSKYTAYLKRDGGSFTFLKHYRPFDNTAGIVSWFLVLGYVGSMAMYAFAFGAFTVFLLEGSFFVTIPFIREIISIGIVLFFLWINTRGVHSSGKSENIMVGAKVGILLLFGVIGLYAILSGNAATQPATLATPIQDFSFIFAISVIFVSFQGFQLLTYEYSVIRGGDRSLEWGIYVSIITSTLIYIMIAFVTTSILTPEEIEVHEEVVLAIVASRIFENVVIQSVASVFIAFAALFSTASALNATIFGTSRLVKTIADAGEFPPIYSNTNDQGVAVNSLLVVTGLTCLFTILGNLEQITGYASLSFLFIFAVVNFVSIRDRGFHSSSIISGIGLLGSVSAMVLFIWYIIQFNTEMLYYIIGITAGVLFLEFIYFRFYKK